MTLTTQFSPRPATKRSVAHPWASLVAMFKRDGRRRFFKVMTDNQAKQMSLDHCPFYQRKLAIRLRRRAAQLSRIWFKCKDEAKKPSLFARYLEAAKAASRAHVIWVEYAYGSPI